MGFRRQTTFDSGPLPTYVQIPLDDAVQTLVALRAIPDGTSGYIDKQGRFVEDIRAVFWFDAQFGAGVADNGVDIIKPDDILVGNAGRWRLAAAPVPAAHAASHQNGGADEISVAALSGELADRQHPTYDTPATVVFGASPYDALITDDVILVDCTGGAVQINLPAVATSDERKITIIKIDATGNAVTVEGAGAETIDGGLNFTITERYSARAVVCDGTEWFSVASNLRDHEDRHAAAGADPITAFDLTRQYSGFALAAVNAGLSPYTVLAADDMIVVDANAGNVILNLPTIAASGRRKIAVFRSDAVVANTITVTPNGAETINGLATFPVPTQYASIVLYSDGAGTDWSVIGIVGPRDHWKSVSPVNFGMTPYTILEIDELVPVDATGGATTINLPAAAVSIGRELTFKAVSIAGGNITIDGSGAETIDGALTLVLNVLDQSETIWCDGTEWHRA